MTVILNNALTGNIPDAVALLFFGMVMILVSVGLRRVLPTEGVVQKRISRIAFRRKQ